MSSVLSFKSSAKVYRKRSTSDALNQHEIIVWSRKSCTLSIVMPVWCYYRKSNGHAETIALTTGKATGH